MNEPKDSEKVLLYLFNRNNEKDAVIAQKDQQIQMLNAEIERLKAPKAADAPAA